MKTKLFHRWYKEKRFIIPMIGVLGLVGVGFIGSGDQARVQNTQVSIPVVQTANETKTQIQEVKTQFQNTDSELSNDNHYINVEGNSVHSPAYSNSVPSGASARCRDGTYSFSQNHRGTCSHHGGVASWL